MRILAVDTATAWESMAILEEESIRAEYLIKVGASHSACLLPAVEHMFRQCSLSPEDVDAYAVGLGPGSFTGVRIAVATIKGMAMARGKLAVGIPTLDAMARAFSCFSLPFCPLIDARRGDVYAALYRPDAHGMLSRSTPFMVLAPQDLRSIVGDERVIFAGDALMHYRQSIEQALGARARFAPPESWYPRASVIGIMALELLKSGKADPSAPLIPIYVRASDAEIRWEQRDLNLGYNK
jgi:tRNA threonylcarbamoyladenosine biosynthesis protein TsaB